MAESSSAIDSALENTAKPLVTTLQIKTPDGNGNNGRVAEILC